MKYDGYRILAFVEENRTRLITRNGNDFTKRFYDVAASLVDLAAGRAMVLDGEMTIIDANGKTSFQALQNHMKNPRTKPYLYRFDLLALDGEDLRGRPLLKEKKNLKILCGILRVIYTTADM